MSEEVPVDDEDEDTPAEDTPDDDEDDGKVEDDTEEDKPKTKSVDKTVWDYVLINDNKPIWTRKYVINVMYNIFFLISLKSSSI